MIGAGVSHWWPTPTRPADHFSASELGRSAALHRPLRRIRLARALARGALLAAAAAVAGRLAAFDAVERAEPVIRALIGGTAVVAPLWLVDLVAARSLSRSGPRSGVRSSPSPRDASDEPAIRSVPRLAATVASLVPLAVAVAVGALLVGPLADPAMGWLVAIGLAGVVVAVAFAATTVRTRRPVEIETRTNWPELAARAGVAGEVRFGLLPEGPEGPESPESPDSIERGGATVTPNACAAGFGRSRWILVDRRLADESVVDAPLADFIVAHELAHLRARHPELQLALNGGAALGALAAVPALAPSGWPWSLVGLAPDDPLSLPVTALVLGGAALVVRLPVAWVLRALERLADRGAATLVGVPDRDDIRALHLATGGELDPPAWSSAAAAHPPAAERLEYLERLRR